MAPSPSALAEALARLEVLGAELVETVPGSALLAFDTELVVRLMSGPSFRLLGEDPQHTIGRPVEDVFPEPVVDCVLPHYRAVVAGETRAFTLRAPEAMRWITARPIHDADGATVGGLAVSWDASCGLEAEERYRLLADNATDIVSRHDLLGRYLYVSPSVTALLGRDPDELLGRTLFDLIHPDDLPGVIAALAGMRADVSVATHAYRMRGRDGSYRWLETAARTVGDPEGPSGCEIQCSTRDITERRRTEEELARRLAQQSAVAQLGRLALERADVPTLVQEACRLVADTLEVDLPVVFEHLDGAQMRVAAGLGWHDGFIGSELEVMSFGGDQPGSYYAEGAVVVDDLRVHPMRGRPLRANGVISGASVLVGDRRRPIGLLGAYSRRHRRFEPEDLDFLSAVAHIVAGAVERVRAEDRIRHDALHDALTGLPNRVLFLDRLRQALEREARDRTRLAVLFVDLDNLKVVNDSLGHDAGDELLRAIGARLASVLRPADTVARFGGDEFAVLVERVRDEREAEMIAGRVVQAFRLPFRFAGEQRFGSASVGLAVSDPARPRSADELLSDADVAMYHAKDRGRGRFEAFDAGLRARVTARLELESFLRRVLAGEVPGGLTVAYQPLWRVPERRIAGVEALARLQHPERGPISPAEFIPVAEDSGLIVALGTHVLRSACDQVARWRAGSPRDDLRLTVNVSARQLIDPGFEDTVAAALADSGLPAAALGLEITENLLLEDGAATAQRLAALHALGAGLILDDFGTGYSALSYLQRYPLDELKIDRAFVHALGPQADGDTAIVRAIVGLAQALGMRVIPEGVETEAQLARLVELGCSLVQGFLLAPPLAPPAFEELLRRDAGAGA